MAVGVLSSTQTDIPRTIEMLVFGAMAKKKRPALNTTSLWFIESREAERKLREDRKKNPKKKTKASQFG